MQHTNRAREAEHRRGHVPAISINDPSHHVTDAIAHMYGNNDWNSHGESARPSFVVTPPRDEERRDGTYFERRPSNLSPDKYTGHASADDRYPTLQSDSPTLGHTRTTSMNSLRGHGSPPLLARTPSSDTAIQRFPLNDIDYESSPAAVAQELSNLQAIRRMSMSVDNADPDLPTFGQSFGAPPAPPSPGADEDDTARLFWVPASLHPELAPKEFKTFVEERVDLIRRKSSKGESLSPIAAERKPGQANLRRKKSTLSKTIENATGYNDGAEVLERRRSGQNQHQRKTSETTLLELENIVGHPTHAMPTSPTSAEHEFTDGDTGDTTIFPPGAVPLGVKRSTRTNYRRGSLRKGERVAASKRGAARFGEGMNEGLGLSEPGPAFADDGTYQLQRAHTEPVMQGPVVGRTSTDSPSEPGPGRGSSIDFVAQLQHREKEGQIGKEEGRPSPQYPVFQSRIASAGRTTASLPGYPGPQGTRTMGESQSYQQQATLGHGQPLPERKSSHEFGRVNTMHTVPLDRPSQYSRSKGYPQQKTLDDMANLPSLMPGTNTNTDALTFIPTFPEDRKSEKKPKERKESGESSRKTGWSSWLRGSDDKDKAKDKKEKEEKESKKARAKLTKLPEKKTPEKTHDTTRLDVLHTASESVRGRESLVLDRESIKIDDERKKDGMRRVFGHDGKKDKDKEPGLFSSLFGGKQKKADRDPHTRKPAIARRQSPEPQYQPMRADIDYNWTRFSILEERAIYRMAHMKLANPRRALYSQVLLSNFMYSYLAKVQQMHPQIQIPQYITQSMQGQHQQPQEPHHGDLQSSMDGANHDEFAQWQQYQQQHGQVSYDLNPGGYDNQHGEGYGQNYIDDYDDGQHHHPQDASWQQSYPQHDEHGYEYHDSQHWEHGGDYSQQGHFDGTRPPEGDVWR